MCFFDDLFSLKCLVGNIGVLEAVANARGVVDDPLDFRVDHPGFAVLVKRGHSLVSDQGDFRLGQILHPLGVRRSRLGIGDQLVVSLAGPLAIVVRIACGLAVQEGNWIGVVGDPA